jgi:hypothetical protein
MVSWLVMLEATKPKELRLAKMVLRNKGENRPFMGFMSGGRLIDVCRS